jgi:membrane-associated protein
VAIVLGRFVPVVRTFITVMAGAGRMPYRIYVVYTVIGGILWTVAVTLLGYFLGNVDIIANNVELILLAGVAVSVVPIIGQLLVSRRRSGRSES